MTGVNFRFDWKANAYIMDGGSPAELTGAEAAQAWLENALHIRRGRLEIMPDDYGTSAASLIGKRLPKSYRMAELQREIEECAALCPAIQSVSDFAFDGEKISFKMACVDDVSGVLAETAEPSEPDYGADRIVNVYVDGETLVVMSAPEGAGYTMLNGLSMDADSLTVNLADIGNTKATAEAVENALTLTEVD